MKLGGICLTTDPILVIDIRAAEVVILTTGAITVITADVIEGIIPEVIIEAVEVIEAEVVILITETIEVIGIIKIGVGVDISVGVDVGIIITIGDFQEKSGRREDATNIGG